MGGAEDAGHDNVQSGTLSGGESRDATQHSQTDGAGARGGREGQQAIAEDGQGASKAVEPLYRESDFEREENIDYSISPWRRPVSIDWGRIVHSASFRRLQGKTQVFPGHESDFFRNRLTHSLEVSQIAEGIADKVNYDYGAVFGDQLIDARLCAAAALMHDLGHPPFGHNGERALDKMMREHGGFEGNAQSLRIVARLEKKVSRNSTEEEPDPRLGLNLSYRALASILKYNRIIPLKRGPEDRIVKGYYLTESKLVERIKSAVFPDWSPDTKFKTVECQIMDLADDIAYSTYDLEDCFKAGFLTPASIMASSNEILSKVANKVSEELELEFTATNVLTVFEKLFGGLAVEAASEETGDEGEDASEMEKRLKNIERISVFNRGSSNLAENSNERTRFSGELVGFAIKHVKLEVDHKCPAMSRVTLDDEAKKQVEVLKQYTYITTIDSPRVKVAEFRGYDVVEDIFRALDHKRGRRLMPDDFRSLYDATEDESLKKRVICDFVAGMTDRYAIEFYARLHSDTAQSMFKPL